VRGAAGVADPVTRSSGLTFPFRGKLPHRGDTPACPTSTSLAHQSLVFAQPPSEATVRRALAYTPSARDRRRCHPVDGRTPYLPATARKTEPLPGRTHSDRGPRGGKVHTPSTTTNPGFILVAARSHAVRDPPGIRTCAHTQAHGAGRSSVLQDEFRCSPVWTDAPTATLLRSPTDSPCSTVPTGHRKDARAALPRRSPIGSRSHAVCRHLR
jgi:hypothetical protein